MRSRWLLGIAANLHGFFHLDAGLVRGAVPASPVGETVADRREIERLQERLENKTRRLERLQEELSEERRRLVAPAATSPEGESARAYVLDRYGREHGLPVVDLLDVLPGFEESVSVRDPSGSGALPADVAFLKALTRQSRGGKYLEVGTWRGEVAANIGMVAHDCVAINLSGGDPAEVGSFEGLIAERAHGNGGTRVVSYESFVFDSVAFSDYFDLVSIEGRGSRERVNLATTNVSGLLALDGAVVWRGYKRGSGQIDWQVLAGILDGCSESAQENLFHVSGTSCAMYLPGFSGRGSEGACQPSGKAFDLTFTATNAPRKLVVLDDAFPNLQSAFRIAEYNAYLQTWKDATVYSTAQNRVSLREEKGFGRVLDEYANLFPELSNRVFRFGGEVDFRGDLAYFIFLGNAARFVNTLDAHDTPFAFTLYPGGGFKLDQRDSDEILRRTCSSPNFKKVIATQSITREYLVDGEFCDPAKIEFVYGGVFPLAELASQTPPKSLYKDDKDTFDLCFVAYKYTKRSIVSKGYDLFVEVAKRLSKTRADVRFHVVGTFDESDIDVSEIRDKMTFYGPRTSSFFPDFYSRMDMILSANVPFALLPGAFDGFPTGSCMEAGLCGVAVLCTDPLDLNVAFEDGEEIVIVPHDAEATSATVERYMDRPDELYRLARRGQEAFARVFGMEAQMRPRLRVLSELLGEGQPPNGRFASALPDTPA